MAGHCTGTDNPVPALFFSLKEQLEQPHEIENLLSRVGEAQSRVQTPDSPTVDHHPGSLQEGLQDSEPNPPL